MHSVASMWPNPEGGAHGSRWIPLLVAVLLIVGCAAPSPVTPNVQSTTGASVLLTDLDITTGQSIYVPAYSEVYFTAGGRTVDLAVTLSIHNTDFENPIVLTSVRYYDTNGQLVREYLDQPLSLGPLASTDFFVDANEQSGGVGTNFVVEWVAEQPVYEPIVEALMLSTASAQGISFTSPGRVINQIISEGD